MAIPLVRDNLKEIIASSKDAHAGLLIQRSLEKWGEDADTKVQAKSEVLDKLIGVSPSDIYLESLKRWINKTLMQDNPNFTATVLELDGRLMSGLALGGALETGATTHHTYGMPILAGSAIKGAVKAYTVNYYSEKDEHGKVILKTNKNGDSYSVVSAEGNRIIEILFGKDDIQDAGYIIWHDAWWIPQNFVFKQKQPVKKPFVKETITVHHQKYYTGVLPEANGTEDLPEANGMEAPIPTAHVAVEGSFYFVIEGHPKWLSFAKTLLEATLMEQGIGAKGTSGYGYFQHSELMKELLDYKQQLHKASLPEDKKCIEELKAELHKENFHEIVGGRLWGKLKEACEKSKDWSKESKTELKQVAKEIIHKMEADKNKKAKELLKSIDVDV